MKSPGVLCMVLGAAMCAAGALLRGAPELGIPFAGTGALLIVAGVAALLLRKRQFRCPVCGAVINVGANMRSAAELSSTGVLKCPRCGTIVRTGRRQ